MIKSLLIHHLDEGTAIEVRSIDGHRCLLPIKNKYITKEEKYVVNLIYNCLMRPRRDHYGLISDKSFVLNDINQISWCNPENVPTDDEERLQHLYTYFIHSDASIPNMDGILSIEEFYNLRRHSKIKSLLLLDNSWVITRKDGKLTKYSFSDSHYKSEISTEIIQYIMMTIPYYRDYYQSFWDGNLCHFNYGLLTICNISDNKIQDFIKGKKIDVWVYRIYLESYYLHNISFRDFLKKCLDPEKGHSYRQSVATKWLNLKNKMSEYIKTLSDDHSDILVTPEEFVSEDVHGGNECSQDIEDAPEREEASSDENSEPKSDELNGEEGQESSPDTSNKKEDGQDSGEEGQEESLGTACNGKDGQDSGEEGQESSPDASNKKEDGQDSGEEGQEESLGTACNGKDGQDSGEGSDSSEGEGTGIINNNIEEIDIDIEIENIVGEMNGYGGFGKRSMDDAESIINVSKELKRLFEKLERERSPFGNECGREFWDTRKLIKARYNPEFLTPSRAKSQKERETNLYMFLDNSGSIYNYYALFKGMLEYSSKYVNVFTGSEAHPEEGIYNGKKYKSDYINCFEEQLEEWIKVVNPNPGCVLIFWGDTCDMNIVNPKRLKKITRQFKCYWLGVYDKYNYIGWEQPRLKEAGFKVIAPVTTPGELMRAIKKIRA